MQLIHIFVAVTFVLTKAEAGITSPSCNTAILDPNFKQEECLGIWYQYADTERCDKCCVIRELTLIEPGLLNITDTIHDPRLEEPIVENFLARRTELSLTYYYGSDTTPMLIINGDCNTYVSLKRYKGTKMEIFTRQVQPLLVPEIPKCDLKVYKFHPEHACLKYI